MLTTTRVGLSAWGSGVSILNRRNQTIAAAQAPSAKPSRQAMKIGIALKPMDLEIIFSKMSLYLENSNIK